MWFKRKSAFIRGQEYAAKVCADHGLNGVKRLEEIIQREEDFDSYNDFDRGCEEYIKRFKESLK